MSRTHHHSLRHNAGHRVHVSHTSKPTSNSHHSTNVINAVEHFKHTVPPRLKDRHTLRKISKGEIDVDNATFRHGTHKP